MVLINNSKKSKNYFASLHCLCIFTTDDDGYGLVAVCVIGWTDVTLVLLQGSPRVSSCQRKLFLGSLWDSVKHLETLRDNQDFNR